MHYCAVHPLQHVLSFKYTVGFLFMSRFFSCLHYVFLHIRETCDHEHIERRSILQIKGIITITRHVLINVHYLS